MSSFHPSFSSFPDFEESSVDKKDKRATKEHASRKGKEKRSRNKERDEDREDRDSGDRHYRSRHGESKNEHSSRRRRSRSQSPERKRSKYETHKSTKDRSWKLLEDDERQKARQDQVLQLENDTATTIGSSKAYFVDKRGDTLNITYGGLHQGDVPKFYRDGKGRVLGMSSVWRISRGAGNKDIEVGRRDKRKAPRYTDSKSLKALVEGPRRLLIAPKPSLTYGEFIPILNAKRVEDIDPKDSYRSIVAEPPPDSDPELEQESGRSNNSDSGDEELEGTTLPAEQEKMKSLEETLRRSPQDERSWLHLISISVESITNKTKRGVKAKAEIATSILKRALDAHRDNEMLPRLRLLYVTYGEEIWDEEKTRRSWNSLLSDFSGKEVPAWKQALARMAFLDWTLANKLSVAEALADARKVLAHLQSSEFEMARARIMWRTAIFLREAGFWEQAMAILQAQMELAFFCPPHLASHSLQDRIDSLEEFWESEVPRFSEDDAQGWAQWVGSGRPEAKSLQRQPSGITETQDPYQQWCYQERALDTVGVFPTRSFTEDESDPYSTIIFSDIRGFISDFKSPDSQKYLALVFLSFLGLNIPGIGRVGALLGPTGREDLLEDGWMVSGQSGWPSKPRDLFPSRSSQQKITWESHAGVAVAIEQPRRSGFGPVKEWPAERSFFEGIDSLCTGRTWEAVDTYGVHIGAVRNTMNQLANQLPSLSWEDMKTALNAAVDVKSAVKASKQQLESHQSDIGLWRTHIKLESIKGDPIKLAKMYTTLLATQSSDPDRLLLYSDAVEYHWLQESEQAAIGLLKQALGIDQDSKGAMYLLRGRNSLSGLFSTNQEWDRRRIAALRLQFFFNLDTGTLEHAISTFNQAADAQNTPNDTKELLYTWISVTVFRLAQRRGTIVPPPVISSLVSKGVQNFSNNTVLLGLFLECERGQGIWGRIRRFLAQDIDATAISQPTKRTAWNLWAEGWSYGPWEPERVRSRLEIALDLKSNKRSVVLWQVYVALEMEVGNLERAKRVLLRALGACWWAKDLYLMAFGPLRAVFSARELNDIVAAMVDRGIRMRRDIQELLEGWIDPSAIEEDENAGDMEVETLLQGREQAKPY